MKHILNILIILSTCQISFGQKIFLKIKGSTEAENKIIDSLQYHQIHTNLSSIEKEILLTSKKLEKLGYLENSLTELVKKNDSTYNAYYELKKQTKYIHIYIGKNSPIKQFTEKTANQDTLILKYPETIDFLNATTIKLEKLGYPKVSVYLENIKAQNNILFADLKTKLGLQRKINQIIIKHKEEEQQQKIFPSNHLAQINKKFRNKVFNQNSIHEIKSEFDKYSFIKQTKQPELLLSKDSTIIYVYLEKRKSNSFDGYIGISNNDEKKTILNGYLDIQLQNILKKGEDFFIYWKSDGNDQKTFRTGITLDYLLKTPIGINAQLNIFKQDSTFQNSKTLIDINYLIAHKTKIHIGIESTISSDIQNSNNNISDYKNRFITAGLVYQKKETENLLFEEKTKLDFRIGIGNRNTSNLTNITKQKQQFVNLNITHNIIINPKNSINIRNQNFFLNSNNYLTNELYRFGGLYSIRGFAENSLQGNYMSAILTEYRLLLKESLYIHSILDYAIFKDKSNSTILKKINTISTLGIGIGMHTKKGFFKFSITNGSNSYNDINIFNSIVNLCYNVKF